MALWARFRRNTLVPDIHSVGRWHFAWSDPGLSARCNAQATQQVLSKLPLTTSAEFNAAVQSAKEAFPKWRDTPIPTRVRVMLKFQQLIREHMVGREQGGQAGGAWDGGGTVWQRQAPQWGCRAESEVYWLHKGQEVKSRDAVKVL